MRFRAFSHVQDEAVFQTQPPIQRVVPPVQDPPMVKQWKASRVWSATEYSTLPKEWKTLLELTKFISNIQAANIQLRLDYDVWSED